MARTRRLVCITYFYGSNSEDRLWSPKLILWISSSLLWQHTIFSPLWKKLVSKKWKFEGWGQIHEPRTIASKVLKTKRGRGILKYEESWIKSVQSLRRTSTRTDGSRDRTGLLSIFICIYAVMKSVELVPAWCRTFRVDLAFGVRGSNTERSTQNAFCGIKFWRLRWRGFPALFY